MAERTVRVLLVGRATPATAALRAAGGRPRLRLVGPVPPEALGSGLGAPVDVVLLTPGIDDVTEAILTLRRVEPRARVLVQGPPEASELVHAVLAAGGCGVVPADLDPASLRDALVRAAAGELVLGDRELHALVVGIAEARSRRAAASASLTARELEVLQGLSDGLGTGEIAERLGISPGTVQSHVKNVLAKLGVHSKVEAVRLAWREGLVAIPA
jgi:DNA-binding NarL/FixJ family response regulator